MSIPRDPQYYRRRAGQLRLAATEPLSAEDRETLIFFADQFDTLADDAESEGRTEPLGK
jgi:hypothetical protein